MGGSVDDDDIENALAGIGSDWEPLDWLPAEGAMAIAGLAIHCRATSPTMTVHVKVYLPVGPNDPPPNKKRGSPERIARLHSRFQELEADNAIATVPIRALHQVHGALIVVMEAVTIIKQLFADDANTLRTETPRALRDLDTKERWLHFDVCPKNVGRSSDGNFCYLDLESMYRIGEKGAVVSDELTKVYRIPSELLAELAAELGSTDGLSPDLAARFQGHQLGRLAMDMVAGNELIGADVSSLAKQDPDQTDLWEQHLVQPLKGGKGIDVGTLADAIKAFINEDDDPKKPEEADGSDEPT